MDKLKSFKRMNENSMLGGICGGIAYAFNLKTWIVRVLVVIFSGTMGLGFVYLVVWLLAPKFEKDPDDYSSKCE